MNRKQRRHAQHQPEGHIAMVNLNEITYPWQMNDEECFRMYRIRTEDNTRETKHPYHHRTANGAIVTPDPTLEYYATRLKSNPKYRHIIDEYEQRHIPMHEELTRDIPPAIPVNHKYYGYDPYERH